MWELVKSSTGNSYTKRKSDPTFQSLSCLSWFYETFYDRLFDIHPSCRSLFKQNMIAQGKALVNMISACLTLLEKPTDLVKALVDLAKLHTTRGVMANQYGLVGECLLWTFDYCLQEEFTTDAKIAWVRIYSLMLSVIIPAAVEEEKKLTRIQNISKSSAPTEKRSPSMRVIQEGLFNSFRTKENTNS